MKRPTLFTASRRNLLKGLDLAIWLLVVITMLVYGIFGFSSGATTATASLQTWFAFFNNAHWRVTKIVITGDNPAARHNAASLLEPYRGVPLLDIDIDALQAKLAHSPYLDDVSVMRLLPDTLRVDYLPRRALARWQKDGIIRIVDQHGNIMAGLNPTAYSHLPYFVGPHANRSLAAMINLMRDFPGLAQQIHAFVHIGQRRWTWVLHNGLEIKLPAKIDRSTLQLLTKLRRDGVFDSTLISLDLRLKDRFYARFPPSQTAAISDRPVLTATAPLATTQP